MLSEAASLNRIKSHQGTYLRLMGRSKRWWPGLHPGEAGLGRSLFIQQEQIKRNKQEVLEEQDVPQTERRTERMAEGLRLQK